MSTHSFRVLDLRSAPIDNRSMSYAICRISKLKTWGNISGSAAHTYRHSGMAPNADPLRLGRNRTLIGNPNQVVGDVQDRVQQLGTPRKNAVLCVEHLLTASPEFFTKMSSKQIDAWARKNITWLKSRYGSDNVRHAVLHMDESTPHIVAYVVPELDGKLNARGHFGGRDKLRSMQSDYAAAMEHMGLQRGVEGTGARHRTVKTFYASLNRIEGLALANLEKIGKPTPPPEPTMATVLSKERRQAQTEAWEKQEGSRTAKVFRNAGQAFVAAETLREDVEVLKNHNSALAAENEELKTRLSMLYEQLELPTSEIGRLRKLDISSVAERLGYLGVVKPNENAIDLVKRVGEFDFHQAVAWLHAEYGPAGAVQAVREHLEVAKPERPLTPAQNTIKRLVHTQLAALGCDSFRLSLIGLDGEGAPYLPGKSSSGERFYTRANIENMIPYLLTENNVHRRHVVVTPMDDHAYYVLVDDLRKTPEEFEAMGFEPCLLQKTSWDSLQAVLKVPATGVDRRAVIDVFNKLNREFGDVAITGLRHPFRLAGFRNWKPKHVRDGKSPFVTLVATVNRFCTKTLDLVRTRQRELRPQEILAPAPRLPRP